MWSRILDDPLGKMAKSRMDANNLEYHNWDHVLSMYDFLDFHDVEYKEELDIAIAYHDSVYDNLPQKEFRSCDAFTKDFGDVSTTCNTFQVYVAILATIGHDLSTIVFPEDEWIIMADLNQLANPISAHTNFHKIKRETMGLYGCTEKEFCEANLLFMKKLRKTVDNNAKIGKLPSFWFDVGQGIDITTELAKEGIA